MTVNILADAYKIRSLFMHWGLDPKPNEVSGKIHIDLTGIWILPQSGKILRELHDFAIYLCKMKEGSAISMRFYWLHIGKAVKPVTKHLPLYTDKKAGYEVIIRRCMYLGPPTDKILRHSPSQEYFLSRKHRVCEPLHKTALKYLDFSIYNNEDEFILSFAEILISWINKSFFEQEIFTEILLEKQPLTSSKAK